MVEERDVGGVRFSGFAFVAFGVDDVFPGHLSSAVSLIGGRRYEVCVRF